MIEESRRTVTVFGAGIAGLTAAHELAIRGFRVTVVAPEINNNIMPSTLDRGIGGMARSQFAIEFDGRRAPAIVNETPTMEQLLPSAEFLVDRSITFDDNGQEDGEAADVIATLCKLIQRLKDHKDPVNNTAKSRLSALWIFIPISSAGAPQNDPRRAYLERSLARILEPAELSDLISTPTVDPDVFRNCIYFGSSFAKMPAEHGFRFFPSFYRHLFDTMKRTPLTNPRPWEVGRETTYDCLVPVTSLGFARNGTKVSFILPRQPVTSFETMRKYLDQVLGQLDYTLDDISRFGLKLFEYMTSSTARRTGQYENMSWGDFVDENSYSAVMRKHVEYGPAMAAALRGSKSDARTQGNIVVQLAMDQVRAGTNPDCTLGGPTSGTWFNHWHDYLLTQNVVFQRGQADVRTGGAAPGVYVGDQKVESAYVVFALPLPEMAKLSVDLQVLVGADKNEEASDLEKVRDLFGDAKTLRDPSPAGSLQHLNGIQFYFSSEIQFWRGHTQYLDSEWGLTSIAQPQFWMRFRDPLDAYRSILSVDIGLWDRPYAGTLTKKVEAAPDEKKTEAVPNGKSVEAAPNATKALAGSNVKPVKTALDKRPVKTVPNKKELEAPNAWCLSDCDIATYTWMQVADHHDQSFRAMYGENAKFPSPQAFSLDQRLCSTEKDHVVSRTNESPYLVNVVGQYPKRPGELSTEIKAASKYVVLADRFVLAGTHMKTFTRLTSMEAANESARHAVNAILDHGRFACDRCQIWDPEDNELPDLQWLRDLDARLFEKGLPHLVKILDWTKVPESLASSVTVGLLKKGLAL